LLTKGSISDEGSYIRKDGKSARFSVNANGSGMRSLGTLLVCLLVGAPSCAGNDNIVQEIDQAQDAREMRLTGYTVTEHYTIRNSRFSAPAETVVATTYVKGTGKTYNVISRTGPSFLQTRVFDRILKEEEEMSRGEQRKSALVTSANYRMKLVGQEDLDGRMCDVVELTPRTKSAHRLRGKAWFDSGSHVLVRIEGKPTSSPSFLAGYPDVVRDYTQVDGFSLARKSHAVSQTFLLGKTDLMIEYTDYRVNGS
jgi:hypothetical protein